MGKLDKLISNAVDICKEYGFDITFETVMKHWTEPHRYWHLPSHLKEMLEGIKELYKDKKVTKKEYEILVIAAVFHDIVYDPRRKDNEEKSVDFMMYLLPNRVGVHYEDIDKIREIIMATKTHDSKEGLSKKFNKLDTQILDATFIDMLDWEDKIYKEYKWVGWKEYKKGRIQFLLSCIKTHTHNVLNIKNLIDFVNKKVPRIGICYYEIDKLPTINKFIEINDKMDNIFDNIIVLITYNNSNYNKEKIKEYGVCSSYEFMAMNEESAVAYVARQSDNITIVKESRLINDYNKEVEKQMSDKVEEFRTIYV